MNRKTSQWEKKEMQYFTAFIIDQKNTEGLEL